MFKEKLQLNKNTRLTSALFIGVSMLIAAGIIWGANMYYDIDTQTIIMEQAATINTPAGKAISFNSSDNSNFTVTGSGKNLTLAAAGGGAQQLIINSAGTGTDALDINATAGGIDIDAFGALTLTGAADSIIDFPNFDVAATGNITTQGGYGLDTNAAGELRVGYTNATTVSVGTTAATILNIGAAGVLTRAINIGTGTGIDTIKIGTGGTAVDVIDIGDALATVTITGASQILAGTGDALTITANNASTWSTSSGLLSITGAGGLTLTSTGGTFTINAAGQTANIDAATLNLNGSTAINIGTTADKPIDVDSTTFDLDASGAITIDATGTVAGNAIIINTTNGGIALTAGGATNGDLTLTAQSGMAFQFDDASGFTLLNDAGTTHLEIGTDGKVTIKSANNKDIVLDAGTGSIMLKSQLVGDGIIQNIVPIFGFDLPAQTLSAAYITVSRILEADPFPAAPTGTTRKYKFIIRYADELTSGTSSWSVCPAATADASCTESFTAPYSTTADLDKGNVLTTDFLTPVSYPWRLAVKMDGVNHIRIYQIFLAAYDQVN